MSAEPLKPPTIEDSERNKAASSRFNAWQKAGGKLIDLAGAFFLARAQDDLGHEFRLRKFAELDDTIAELRAEIAELRAASTKGMNLADCYKGTFLQGQRYERGAVLTDQGSLWLCLADTSDRPGDGGTWRMIVKRGRNAKDATP